MNYAYNTYIYDNGTVIQFWYQSANPCKIMLDFTCIKIAFKKLFGGNCMIIIVSICGSGLKSYFDLKRDFQWYCHKTFTYIVKDYKLTQIIRKNM